MPPPALRDSNLIPGVISFSNTGDNTIIAATANKSSRVYKIFFVANASTIITFKEGSNDLSGPIPLASGGAFVLDTSNDPWFTTSIGSAFIISQTGTATIGGTVYYHKP